MNKTKSDMMSVLPGSQYRGATMVSPNVTNGPPTMTEEDHISFGKTYVA